MLRLALVLAVALLAAGCGGSSDGPAPAGEATTPEAEAPAASPARILVVTETTGFRHGSIPAARTALEAIDARAADYELDFSTLAGLPEALSSVDAVAFVLTSGELPATPEARDALIAFVEEGGGFLGVHSAADTFYEFPRYEGLIGSWLRDHPYTDGTLRRVVADHPATKGLPPEMPVSEELYRFRDDPRSRGMVPLLELSGVSDAPAGEYLPSAWCGRAGSGRTIYTALGHLDATWQADWFRDHINGALAWAAGTRPSEACG